MRAACHGVTNSEGSEETNRSGGNISIMKRSYGHCWMPPWLHSVSACSVCPHYHKINPVVPQAAFVS